MNREKYLTDRASLMDKAKGFLDSGDLEKFDECYNEVEKLDARFENEAKAEANYNALNGRVPNANPFKGPNKFDFDNEAKKDDDAFASREYNVAFMNFVKKGTPIPEKFKNEAQSTTTSDVSATIPTNILGEMIKNLKSRGNIYAKVRKLNIQGGVAVPILSLIPTATWIGENGKSDSQKTQANTKVIFNYYGLECKLSQSLIASVATLEMFQAEFASLGTEAIVTALEKGIFNGTGSGQMLGIVKDPRIPEGNVIELSAEEMASWTAWKKKVFTKMKKSYRNGDFIMAQSTFDGYIDGMVDSVGQPIGRVNYGIDGAEKYRFGGKNIETVEEDIIADFDTASAGDVVAVFGMLNNYAINSNMQMRVDKWEDHDTHEIKNNCILICDGKILDPNGFLIIKKKASV